MDKEEKKQTGVSLFGQSEFLVGDDPLEEMFALNLGDFISETLISEGLTAASQPSMTRWSGLLPPLSGWASPPAATTAYCA